MGCILLIFLDCGVHHYYNTITALSATHLCQQLIDTDSHCTLHTAHSVAHRLPVREEQTTLTKHNKKRMTKKILYCSAVLLTTK